jgi:nucleoside-diphosphate-sugar epimerase
MHIIVVVPDKFDAVIDFSAYGPREIMDAVALLRGGSGSSSSEGGPAKSKVTVYILISTDSVYDVCDPDLRSPGQIREADAVRPSDPERRRLLAEHHEYGNGKLQAEEELVKQREPSPENATDDAAKKPEGIPFIILRLPDVLGPRDTTYRFWFYQLWVRVAAALPQRPVIVPQFLVGYNNSFVYVDDVAKTLVDLVDRVANGGEQSSKIIDEIFNLAWPQNITLDGLLHDIESVVKSDDAEPLAFNSEDSENMYLYPTVRFGPIDSSKAAATFGWLPSDWKTAIKSTVDFYEAAMKDPKWQTQRDEIVQIVAGQLYSGSGEDREGFISNLEKIYGIDLAHFRPKRDEL